MFVTPPFLICSPKYNIQNPEQHCQPLFPRGASSHLRCNCAPRCVSLLVFFCWIDTSQGLLYLFSHEGLSLTRPDTAFGITSFIRLFFEYQWVAVNLSVFISFWCCGLYVQILILNLHMLLTHKHTPPFHLWCYRMTPKRCSSQKELLLLFTWDRSKWLQTHFGVRKKCCREALDNYKWDFSNFSNTKWKLVF